MRLTFHMNVPFGVNPAFRDREGTSTGLEIRLGHVRNKMEIVDRTPVLVKREILGDFLDSRAVRQIIFLRDFNVVQMAIERKPPNIAKLIRIVQVVLCRKLAIYLVHDPHGLG
ncbi:MAG: hypothetical protein BWY42_00837 [Candidatus Omnitrophica bacterium ADurb.Bin277]|nr:MAG: hypothetical protein BWY42_00837 [Candidatus Omnitrophica bacterium ADurb.Bin277]